MIIKLINRALLLTLSGIVGIAFVAAAILFIYGRQLPNHEKLADYKMPLTTKVFADDASLAGRYAIQNRLFQSLDKMPPHLVSAFLAAEDRSFWKHHGLDGKGLARAMWRNLIGLFSGARPQGGSTITQQVSKNFLLNSDITLERKIKELILSFRLEHSLTKEQILGLYLNGIYFGQGNWGVTSAAIYYFGVHPAELTIAQAAYLAALPKSPNNYHPVKHHHAALTRRNWIIKRMEQDNTITSAQASDAINEPLEAPVGEGRLAKLNTNIYFTKEVRRILVEALGEEALYQGGLAVHTSLDPELQKQAQQALRKGLEKYDRKTGWRGETPTERIEPWQIARIATIDHKTATVVLPNGDEGIVEDIAWIVDSLIFPITLPRVGHKVYVEQLANGNYDIKQIPEVSGAIVAMDIKSGRVKALYGGFSPQISQYNRATQALRQPGSAFKPVVFLAALENGFKPSDEILDSPFIYDQGEKFGIWQPSNFSGKFYGRITLSDALAKSRNLATIRLANNLGIEKVKDTATRLGLAKMPSHLSIALGSKETTLLQLTSAYATIAGGGLKVTPTLIDYVQDNEGNTIYQSAKAANEEFGWSDALRVVDKQNAEIVTQMLRRVVTHGTARKAITLKNVGGKTGTTNNAFDLWFIGFTPKLAVGVFMGFDNPKSLGPSATGGSLAAPIFNDFVGSILATKQGNQKYGGNFSTDISPLTWAKAN